MDTMSQTPATEQPLAATLSEVSVRLGITREQAIAICIRKGVSISNGRVSFEEFQRAMADEMLH